jgi:hypothetical protein
MYQRPETTETILGPKPTRRTAADIIKAGEAFVTISIGKGRHQQTRREMNPQLARCLQGSAGIANARALLTACATDEALRRAGEAQGIDWEAWSEWLEQAG